MPKKLSNLDIKEISGVNHPAHLHPGWLVIKSADIEPMESALKDVLKHIANQEEAPVSESTDAETTEDEAVVEEESEDTTTDDALATDSAQEVSDDQASDDASDDTAKALETADLKEQIASMEKQIKAQAADIEKAQDEARLEKAVTKVKEWAPIPGIEDFAPTLAQLRKDSPEIAVKVEEAFDATTHTLKEANILTVVGKDGEGADLSDPQVALTEANKRAEARAEEKGISKEAAFVEVTSEDAALAKALRAKKGA
jgi:hypothetical protein